MDDQFVASLFGAIGNFIGENLLTLDTPSSVPVPGAWAPKDQPSPFAEQLKHLAELPASGGASTGPVGLGQVREFDPKFDLAVFLARVGEMFSAYQNALDRGDLTPIRRFVAEESWADIKSAAEKTGRRPGGVRTWRIKAIRPMTATHEGGLDTIRVLISANETNDDGGITCEYWELIRKSGAQTRPGLDLTHCPNCGAPITGDDPTRCSYCGERLADPAFDWVANKITPQ